MIDASVVDLPEPVGPVTRTKPRGSVASQSAGRGQAELLVGGDAGGDDAQGERGLATLGEHRATEPRLVLPGEGEVDVQLLFEGRLLLGVEERAGDRVDLRAGEGLHALDREQAAVHADPRGRSTGEQEVGALVVPEDPDPGIDRLHVELLGRHFGTSGLGESDGVPGRGRALRRSSKDAIVHPLQLLC